MTGRSVCVRDVTVTERTAVYDERRYQVERQTLHPTNKAIEDSILRSRRCATASHDAYRITVVERNSVGFGAVVSALYLGNLLTYYMRRPLAA